MFDDDVKEFMKRFKLGAPVPPVNPDALKEVWQATRRAEQYAKSHPGLTAVAGPRSSERALGTHDVCLTLRARVLSSLFARGVLRERVPDESLNEAVFLTAAAMPLDRVDLDEALTLLHLSVLSEDDRSKAKQALRTEGYDPDSPKIDSKFLRSS
jgi:hypothetical protein